MDKILSLFAGKKVLYMIGGVVGGFMLTAVLFRVFSDFLPTKFINYCPGDICPEGAKMEVFDFNVPNGLVCRFIGGVLDYNAGWNENYNACKPKDGQMLRPDLEFKY